MVIFYIFFIVVKLIIHSYFQGCGVARQIIQWGQILLFFLKELLFLFKTIIYIDIFNLKNLIFLIL